ncbi:MAG TPA: HEAT repeat domain-containing protein [Clostridiales bacterium]|nr:HEAT repeat domain-containing protein [Clostridiales bacterium]
MFGVTEQKIEKWKSKNKVDKIVEAMNHKDKVIRLAAIKAGAGMKDEKIFNALVIFLNDPDPLIRAGSVDSLGSLGIARAQDHLRFVSLNDSDENVREKALEAMKNIIAKKM